MRKNDIYKSIFSILCISLYFLLLTLLKASLWRHSKKNTYSHLWKTPGLKIFLKDSRSSSNHKNRWSMGSIDCYQMCPVYGHHYRLLSTCIWFVYGVHHHKNCSTYLNELRNAPIVCRNPNISSVLLLRNYYRYSCKNNCKNEKHIIYHLHAISCCYQQRSKENVKTSLLLLCRFSLILLLSHLNNATWFTGKCFDMGLQVYRPPNY